MTPDPAADRLAAAALRLTATDPARVGYWLARHRETEGLSADALAAKLGLDVPRLATLAVCLAPAPDTFAADTAAVAGRVGVDATALGNLIRQEQAVSAWAEPASAAGATTDAGWLLAAHDADQPPAGDEADDPAPR